MDTHLYLAYGSNLHPLRMLDRVPSTRLVGVTRLDRCSVAFAKRGRDGSGKSSLLFTDNPDDVAYGAVYEISGAEKHLLDRAEGLGNGYEEAQFRVAANGSTLAAFAYIAAQSHLAPGLPPYDWYKDLVIAGASHHKFPETYIASLHAVQSCPDPDHQRWLQHENLLLQIESHERRTNISAHAQRAAPR
jgi:hypothetical protein